jgi:hypothetical protein
MKYFEKIAESEAEEMKRLSTKPKKVNKPVTGKITVIPEDKLAPIIDKAQTALTRSRGRLAKVYHTALKIK